MNSIVIGGHAFTDKDILSGSIHLENSMIAETLSSDTLSVTIQASEGSGQLQDVLGVYLFSVNGDPLYASDSVDVDSLIASLAYGDPVEFYHNEVLYAKFYMKTARQVAKNAYTIECVSIVGLLVNVIHYGGIYGLPGSTDTVGDVIADIMGNFPYTLDAEIAALPIYGWLPIASARDNLQKILFSIGASVMKTISGGLEITFNQPDIANEIADDALYMGGKNKFASPATAVSVTEHTYYEGGLDAEQLFTNVNSPAAVSAMVSWSSPHYDYSAVGLTIEESHPNYCIVSGVGTLTGRPYAHQTRIVQKTNLSVSEEKVISVTDDTVISQANSASVVNRLANYYLNAKETDYGVKIDDEHSGELVLFQDEYGGKITGYIKSMDITMSEALKSETVITTNWRPTDVGNSYNAYIIVKAEDIVGGTWSVPPELQGQDVRLVLVGGLRGGDSGGKGADAYWTYSESPENGTYPGLGGEGGNGGKGAMILVIDMTLDQASYSASIGSGGAGGVSLDGTLVLGDLGGDTTFSGYSSAGGTERSNYVNIIDGSLYVTEGLRGEDGGDGGHGGTVSFEYQYISPYGGFFTGSTTPSEAGENFGAYQGGSSLDSGRTYVWDGKTAGAASPGGGGGAAAGNNGSTGTMPDQRRDEYGDLYYVSGDGGDGANATTIPTQAAFGVCGTGGYGGGGGGASGGEGSRSIEGRTMLIYLGAFGKGGLGSQGGQGSDGFIIVYYTEA